MAQTGTAWTINKAVVNIPSEGTHLVRIESVEAGQSGENAKNPGADLLKFRGIIVRGDDDGKSVYYVRSLLPQALGILAADLANTGLWQGDEEMPPLDDPEAIAQTIEDAMGGKVFMYEVKHRDWQGQTRGEYTLVGPSGL
jgi:hypothetical protein